MSVIERVAELVGENGKVDLGNYEKLILVEVYRVCCVPLILLPYHSFDLGSI